MGKIRWTTLAATTISVLVIAASASAVLKLPTPGSPAQVKKLVASSHLITKLSSTVLKQLPRAAGDSPGHDYPATRNGCAQLTKCVFGDTKAAKTIVLMGDSHAQMWIPAINRIGQLHKVKVILLFLPQCPAASLDVWLQYTHTAFPQCTAARNGWISAINKLHPASVILSDRTAGIYSTASGGTQTFTDAQWQAGMQTTLTALAPSKAKLAILGDLVTMSLPVPSCLAAYPTKVQSCGAPNPNPSFPGHQAAERAAAKAAGALYVDPTQWLCTKICSPVIGNFIAYYDNYHVSVTYAGYLSGVLQGALKTLL